MALVLGCILVTPIWIVDYPPLVDYPNHLAGTFIIAHLHDPQFEFARFYGVSWNVYPYVVMDLILVALQQVMSITLAGKILLSITALIVPAGAWAFLRQANPGNEGLAVFALLIPYNALFISGLIGTYLSLGLCFFCLALWLKYAAQPRWSYCGLLLGLTTALYFTHLLGFVVAGLITTGLLALKRLPLRQWLSSWALFVPGVACYGWLRFSSSGHWTDETFFKGFGHKVLGFIEPIRGYSNWLDIVTAALILGALGLGWRRSSHRPGWNSHWAALTGALGLIYFALPVMYGDGWDADRRVLLFAFVTALAVPRVGKQLRWVVLVGLALFGMRIINVAVNFVNEQPRLQAMQRSFAAIPPNVRLLPVVEVDQGAHIRDAHVLYWGYGLIERGWFSPYTFDDRNVHALRRTYQPYIPYEWTSVRWDQGKPDLGKVRHDYDYVWAYRVPQFAAEFRDIGSLVYQDGDIAVYRITR